MTWIWESALAAGGVGLVAGAFVPQIIARVPEPEPEPEPAPDRESVPDAIAPAEDEAAFARPLDDPKDLYVDVAALPGLRWKAAVVSAVAAGAMGARTGFHPILLLLLFLVPVCVALAVIDWRTRYLPTALIAPSYVVAVVLAVLASALTGDWGALQVSLVGWVVTFVVFFVLWFVYPKGLGYGDVRLSGLLAIALGWLGTGSLLIGLYAGFLLGGIGGLLLSALKVFHRRHYPFGPFMVLGAWLGAAFPGPLGSAFGWVVAGLSGLVS